MEGCCGLIIIIVVIGLVVFFSVPLLYLVMTIYYGIRYAFVGISGAMKRSKWSKTLTNVSPDELRKLLDKLEYELQEIKKEEDRLNTGFRVMNASQRLNRMSEIEAIRSRASDTEARIRILKSRLRKT